ncbi:MAG: metallophosphoesterase family protein [bacterium]|nr:metallophosphoesterase family protein [bacterium]
MISDTHGSINPAAFDYFKDVELILHAGDIGKPDIIRELELFAPVTAVLGNTDGFSFAGRYAESEIIYIKGKKVYLTHAVINGNRQIPYVMEEISNIAPDIVVFGHTHRQHAYEKKGIFFFNPGSAGPAREGTRPSVGLLTVGVAELSHEIFYLD